MIAHGNDHFDHLDADIARRVERLRHRPLEMARLRERVRSAVSGSLRTGQTRTWLMPLRAVAASLLLVGAVVAVILMTSGGPVLASAAELSRVHRDNVAGASNSTAVDTMQSAGQVLASQWRDCPHLPNGVAAAVVSCQLRSLGGKRLACLVLEADGQTVTLAFAHAADIQVPTSPRIERDGVTYSVQSSGGVNIVESRRGNLWVSIMGELPAERLIDLAASLRI